MTLKFDSDDDGVTGELLSFEDNTFRLQTAVGPIVVKGDEAFCIGEACPPGTTRAPFGGAIVLKSLDDSTQLEGTLVDIVNDQYVVQTDVGEMAIDVDKVTCEGADCLPQTDRFEFGGKVVLVGASDRIEGVLIDQTEEAFIVEVPVIGAIRASKSAYACEGEGCP